MNPVDQLLSDTLTHLEQLLVERQDAADALKLLLAQNQQPSVIRSLSMVLQMPGASATLTLRPLELA